MTELREGTAAEAGMVPERVAHLRVLAKGWVEGGHTPTLVVLAARRGIVVLHEAFGQLRPEPDAPPLRVDSIFPISSLTKPITATAAMILVEEGRLGLNRPIKDYIPEIVGQGAEEVTVHHLLTHTSGYRDEEVYPALMQKMQQGFDPGPAGPLQHPTSHLVLSVCYPMPVSKPPGTEMMYSNANFELVAEIIRRVNNRRLEDFARERIFAPLGMNDSSYVVPDAQRPRVVKRPPAAPFGAQTITGGPGMNSREAEERPSGSGGVFTTAKDMAVFGQMFLNGGTYGGTRILSRPTISAMTRNQIPDLQASLGTITHKRASYGYGWVVRSDEKWKYWHGSLVPLGTFEHPGAGGASLWIDTVNQIVGAYFEVTMRITPAHEHLWNFDLYQNAVTASVAE